MRTVILALNFGTDNNACYMNSALLAELWACYMDDSFVWADTGMWRTSLLRLFGQTADHQFLIDMDCLGPLL